MAQSGEDEARRDASMRKSKQTRRKTQNCRRRAEK